MVSFLSDAECFIDSFRLAIESAPLQVYHSGLVFAPKNSIIRGTFGDSAPRWVENIWPLQEEWNERVQLLEGHHGPVTTISLPDDDRFLASGSADGSIKIWDLSHGKCLHTLHENDGAVNATAFSTNGAQVASASSDIISVWDAGSGRRLQSFSGHDGSIRLLSFSQDDQKLISYSFDRTIKTWSLRTGLCTESIATTSPACSATFSSDGQRIALGLFDDAVIEVWNLSPGRRPSIIRGRRSSARDDAVRTSAFSVRAIAFSQSGDQLVSCSSDKIIKLWNTTTLHCTKTLAINDIVHSIAFAPDGRRLVVSVDSTNDAVRVCDLRTGRISQTMQSHDGPVCKAIFSTDGKRLISASFDGSVRIWPAESSHPYGSHLGYGGKTDSLTLSSGGRWFASASEQDGYRLRIWNTANVEDVQELHGHNSSVRAIDFSANDQWLASGSANGTTRIWDVSRGRCVRVLPGQAQAVHSVAFSPNLRSLISGLEDGTLELWDLLHSSCVRTLRGHSAAVGAVVVSPDGGCIASGACDSLVKVWGPDLDVRKFTLAGHVDAICSLAYCSGAARLASASWDSTIRIWDTSSGTCLRTIDGQWLPANISFLDWNNTVLSTAHGIVDLDRTLLDTQPSDAFQQDVNLSGWGVSPDRTWIMKDGKCVLWLPLQYRPRHIAMRGSTIVILSNEGRTLCMQFQVNARV